MPQPKYSAGELASNGLTIAAIFMRRGRMTDTQRRRLERNTDSAKTRGGVTTD